MITTTREQASLEVEQAYQAWRSARWSTEWGGVWQPPQINIERDAFAAGWEAHRQAAVLQAARTHV